MDFWKGYVKIRVHTKNPQRFFQLCSNRGITLKTIVPKRDAYEMILTAQEFKTLAPIRRKTETHIKIIEKHGLPFFFKKCRKRKVVFFGIFAGFFFIYITSLFVWDIRISGNQKYTDEILIASLLEEKVYPGKRKSTIDCIELSQAIRKKYDDIVWVSSKIEGTCLLISIKENADSYIHDPMEKTNTTGDIIAKKGGIIKEIITRKGIPMKEKGDSCAPGDLLISGSVPILNQDMEITRYEYLLADGDIYIETSYHYYHEFSMNTSRKLFLEEKHSYPALQIFDTTVTIPYLGKNTVASYLDTKKLALTPTMILPIQFGYIYYVPYQIQNVTYTKEEALEIADKNLQDYLNALVSKGSFIISKNINTLIKNNLCVTKGKIQVIEKTGKIQSIVIE